MPTKVYKPEQIIRLLREVEIHQSKGLTVPQACNKIGVHEQTYYRWRREYGGLSTDQAKRLTSVESDHVILPVVWSAPDPCLTGGGGLGRD